VETIHKGEIIKARIMSHNFQNQSPKPLSNSFHTDTKIFKEKKAKKQVEQNRWLLSCATIVKNQSKIV